MTRYLVPWALMLGCAGARSPARVPVDNSPALVVDGTVRSCSLATSARADTGCPALALRTVKAVSFLRDSEAVVLFGPAARYGAYVAQTPTLDMTPASATSVVLVVMDGARFTCTTPPGADSRRLDGPGLQCSSLKRLSPDDIDRIELLKPPRAIELFGREGAAGVVIVILKRHP